LGQRQAVKKIALFRPVDHDLSFSTWSLSKLAEFLVAEGWSTTSAATACGTFSRKEGVRFQVIKTWKTSTDPDYEAKKNRVLELYDIADGKTAPGDGDPQIVFCRSAERVLYGRVRTAQLAAPTGQAVGACGDQGR
jgi:hypothetical protein